MLPFSYSIYIFYFLFVCSFCIFLPCANKDIHINISIIEFRNRFQRRTGSDVTMQTHDNDAKLTAATSETFCRRTSSTLALHRDQLGGQRLWRIIETSSAGSGSGAPSRPARRTSPRLGRLLFSSTASSQTTLLTMGTWTPPTPTPTPTHPHPILSHLPHLRRMHSVYVVAVQKFDRC